MFVDEELNRLMEKRLEQIDPYIKVRAKEILDKFFNKTVFEEISDISKLNNLSLSRFGRLYNDLNASEKDEIMHMAQEPLKQQPAFRHLPTQNIVQPKGQAISETQEVLKTYTEKPGMGRSDKWWDIYHALRRQGMPKERAASIASSKEKALDKKDAEASIKIQDYISPERNKPDPFTDVPIGHQATVNIIQPRGQTIPREQRVLGKGINALDIKFKHGEDPDDTFNANELSMGVKVEMEHTDDIEISKMIAKAHLAEISDYYTRLKIMEESAKKPVTKSFNIQEGNTDNSKLAEKYNEIINNDNGVKPEIKSDKKFIEVELTREDPLKN